MSNATELRHYVKFPMCGFCQNAWDVLYGRIRTSTPLSTLVGWCPVGGCDPDIWDFIDERTGWPKKWKIDEKTHLPVVYRNYKSTVIPTPETDNRVFHKRSDDSQTAPWRKVLIKLHNDAAKKKIKDRKPTDLDEIDWGDEDDEDLFGPNGDDAVEHAAQEAESSDDDDDDWDW